MLVLVLLFAIPLGYVAGQFKIVRERKAILAEIRGTRRGNEPQIGILEEREQERLKSWCGTWSKRDHERIRVSRLRKLFGDVTVSYIRIWPRQGDTRESLLAFIRRIEETFPEAALEAGSSYRDSLLLPANEREPNRGTIFKTGLFEE